MRLHNLVQLECPTDLDFERSVGDFLG
jgi:hypothetical protein